MCGFLALVPQASNKTLGPKNTTGSLGVLYGFCNGYNEVLRVGDTPKSLTLAYDISDAEASRAAITLLTSTRCDEEVSLLCPP